MKIQNMRVVFHHCFNKEDELDIAMREILKDDLKNAVIVIPSSEDYHYVKRYFDNKRFRYKLTNLNTNRESNLPLLIVNQTPELCCGLPVIVVLFFQKIKNKDLFLQKLYTSSSVVRVTYSNIYTEEYNLLLDKGFPINKRELLIEAQNFQTDDHKKVKHTNSHELEARTKENNKIYVNQTITNSTMEQEINKTAKFMVNEEIREVFINTFFTADSEIDIISPWMSGAVVDEELLILMENALQRGVKIKIIYGIGSGEDERGQKSEKVAELLNSRLGHYGELFKIQRSNTHYKLLLCDDKYAVSGSYNFLSFRGDYRGSDRRMEGADFITNKEEIISRRGLYFNF